MAHRVVRRPPSGRAKPDRFSYALFVDSSLDESVRPGLFAYEPGSSLHLESGFGTFLNDILDNTYRGTQAVCTETAPPGRRQAMAPPVNKQRLSSRTAAAQSCTSASRVHRRA
ncbi:hypothetical protein [Streptomyces syringium]|uniref:hypothetical protein n=1 Tax=Streptomyces syringium TaxID=76729 RepID=UPI0033B1CB32